MINGEHKIVLIVHDIRSCHNVGALLRTADGLGIEQIHFTGYTPYPLMAHDKRLPHLAMKLDRQIHKTALGAEKTVAWRVAADVKPVLRDLKADGYRLVGLEQSPKAIPLPKYTPVDKIALLLGREVEGIESNILAKLDEIIEIPMFGQKESFNVVQAAAIALYQLRFA